MRHLLIVLAVVGCKGSSNATPDAGVDGAQEVDAGPDAGSDAGSGSGSGSGSDGGVAATDVRVLVRDGFAPIEGVRVLFDGADATHTELTTDATGAATATMAMGGNVTVIRTYTSGHDPEIYSYLAVKPGEILHVGHVLDTITPPAPMTVAVPVGLQGPVTVVTSCGAATGNPPTVTIQAVACPPKVALHVADSAGFGFAAKVPYATTLDVSQHIAGEDLSTTVHAYNVTPDLASVTAEARGIDGTHALYSTGAIRVDQAPSQRLLPDLRTVLDELVLGTMVATAGGTQVVATRSVWAPMPVSVDASGGLLPYLRQPATFTPATITWVEDGTATVDAVIATIDVTTTTSHYRRIILAPYGGMSLDVPQLAGADTIYNPAAADTLVGALGLVGATGGYDALRPFALSVTSIVDATPALGRVTLSYSDSAPPTL